MNDMIANGALSVSDDRLIVGDTDIEEIITEVPERSLTDTWRYIFYNYYFSAQSALPVEIHLGGPLSRGDKPGPPGLSDSYPQLVATSYDGSAFHRVFRDPGGGLTIKVEGVSKSTPEPPPQVKL
jgi:hypothetical protein